MNYYIETVKRAKMMQQMDGRKADYRAREHGTDRVLATCPTHEAAAEAAEAKLTAEAAEKATAEAVQPQVQTETHSDDDAPVTGDEIEAYDREQYNADEWVRKHDSIDDMDDYRPKMYTGATSEKLTDEQVRVRRAARRQF